jgi:two-component system sensor histidine kinase BarA
MEANKLPIIDWELAIKLAGNKREVAEEILGMLLKTLHADISAIQHSFQQQKYHEMGKQLHKLHGALCYCGLPRIKNLVAQMEVNIKNDTINDLSVQLESLNTEVNLLMKQL